MSDGYGVMSDGLLRRLPITHYPLPITHYPLPITHYPLPITHRSSHGSLIAPQKGQHVMATAGEPCRQVQ